MCPVIHLCSHTGQLPLLGYTHPTAAEGGWGGNGLVGPVGWLGALASDVFLLPACHEGSTTHIRGQGFRVRGSGPHFREHQSSAGLRLCCVLSDEGRQTGGILRAGLGMAVCVVMHSMTLCGLSVCGWSSNPAGFNPSFLASSPLHARTLKCLRVCGVLGSTSRVEASWPEGFVWLVLHTSRFGLLLAVFSSGFGVRG